jgi:AraC-like DNA-binding protein
MANLPMVDARWACLAVERLKEERVPIDPILKKASLTRRRVSDPDAQIPFHKHAALLTLAAEDTGDDCFGLHLSTSIAPQQAGVLGYVLLNSATLGDALVNLVRYYRVLTEGPEFDFMVGKNEAMFVDRIIDPMVVDERQAVEFRLGVIYRFCQLITGRDLQLSRVEFQHAKPKEARTVRQVFGAPVRYERDRNAMVLEGKLLNCPIQTADNKLVKILKRHCRLILGTRPKTGDFVFEVQQLITTLLPSGQPKIDAIAQELGMSSRTLTRRLSEEGLTYKGLLEEVRRKLALQYLKDRRISLKQVAYLLGYSEVSAFYHAFRRWTGSSPVQHRLKS